MKIQDFGKPLEFIYTALCWAALAQGTLGEQEYLSIAVTGVLLHTHQLTEHVCVSWAPVLW